MRVLALETSSMAGSVAVLDGVDCLHERNLPANQRTAQSLHVVIAEVLKAAAWRPQDIQLIAVSQGPGSFTGLRVGVTAAKVLAYAVGTKIVGVNTLKAMAARAATQQIPGDQTNAANIVAVLSAQRGDLFSAKFRMLAGGELEVISPTEVIATENWLSGLSPHTLVTGTGLKSIKERLPHGVVAANASFWNPQSVDVGLIGFRLWELGQVSDPWRLTPRYYRPSAAEEKRASSGVVGDFS